MHVSRRVEKKFSEAALRRPYSGGLCLMKWRHQQRVAYSTIELVNLILKRHGILDCRARGNVVEDAPDRFRGDACGIGLLGQLRQAGFVLEILAVIGRRGLLFQKP
jgi:hypothetical protein